MQSLFDSILRPDDAALDAVLTSPKYTNLTRFLEELWQRYILYIEAHENGLRGDLSAHPFPRI